MKIALVSEHASPLATLGGVDAGGQNVHVDALAAALTARGDDVTVYTRRDSPRLPDTVTTSSGYTVEHVPAGPPTEIPKDQIWPYMGEFARFLARRWTEAPVDVVHAHFWMSGAAATWAARQVGVPVAQTFHALGSVKRRHQGAADTSPADRLSVEASLCRNVDLVLATCSDEVRELLSLGVTPHRVTVVPCGVDTTLFTPEPAAPRERPRLLSVGRLVERKGFADIIAALPALPEVELVVVGGPEADALDLDPEARRLWEIADRLGVAERVRLVGGVPRGRMPEAFAQSDLVVVAPWYEPFGIVPLEAMASGRPVVGTAVGGLLDSVEPGVTGELVPPRDPEAIAAAVRRFLDDPLLGPTYGARGASRARTAYSWENVARKTHDALARLVVSERTEVIGR
ncbi:glycosyltransferase [Mumia zhuanghuii]|uniref:Glycosyltransferase family 1 protein n=1 Tax=Mumia zhuanghuii TaxID=2585211 RepID=A0A5C4MKU0_9ACTN|nr:glycosyltransferase [Mumia zhuanghuii]TNC36592.1 glycosyltransferase family 1 protein [Mumia zhuanghuii]TNC46355.1 glycosyltransferase family 1 protein [Mumia zhuanghuii]